MNARTFVTTALLGAAIPAALLAPGEAHAWRHLGQVWLPQDLPLEYIITEQEEESVPAGYSEEAIHHGFDEWASLQCGAIESSFTGLDEDNTPFAFDNENRFSFNDPGDELSPGVLGATVTRPPVGIGEVAFVRQGRTYYRSEDSDIVFNDNVQFATDESIFDGTCDGGTSLKGVATHEIGHMVGLGHSCEQDEACNDLDLLEATMYWSLSSCDAHQSEIAADDIEAMNVLYGRSVQFQCSHELDPDSADTIALGIIPFELKCRIMTDFGEEIEGATWYWGDGATSTEIDEASHQYTEPGNYTVRACFDGFADECGDWQFCARRESYVRACGVPEAQFDLHHVNGLTYKFMNQTDISVYGCVFDVQWDIFQGGQLIDSVPAWEPEYTFDEEGDYRVVLNVGGPAGTAAADVSFTAQRMRGEGYGCSTTGGVGGLGGLAILLGLAGIRRRRS